MLETFFIFENEYKFMLNNNFELLASSINFEDEYHLNQRILQAYNIKFLDIVKIKPEKLSKKFEKEFKKIQYEKLIRQVKTQEYFVPQLYVPPKEKIFSMVNQKYFSSSKSNLLSKISKITNKVENDEHANNHEDSNNDDEGKELIQNENNKNSISELFVNSGDIVFHKTYIINLNKGTFIESLAKELIKIPENDLIFENDKNSLNLIKSSKQLISKLLTKKELANHLMRMTIKFSFYYDKPFYFITIDDEKKLYLTISKTIHFQNNHKNEKNSSSLKNKNTIPYNKNDKKSKNKVQINKEKQKENKNSFREKNNDSNFKNNKHQKNKKF